MLKRHPSNRLGSGPDDANPIKAHQFFRPVNWDALLAKKVEPPYNVTVVSLLPVRSSRLKGHKGDLSLCLSPAQQRDDDTSLFDSKFTDQPAVDSPVDTAISASADQNFSGFTYVAPSVLEEMRRINYPAEEGEEFRTARGPR